MLLYIDRIFFPTIAVSSILALVLLSLSLPTSLSLVILIFFASMIRAPCAISSKFISYLAHL